MILIKYGELTTKKGNRATFIKLLVKNINNLLKGIDYKIRYDRVRMFISSEDIDKVISIKINDKRVSDNATIYLNDNIKVFID